MRPEEYFWLRWEDLTWVSERNGVLFITRGKTAAAHAVLSNDSSRPHCS